MFTNKIKCVIWDLDETIWDGSLAENDDIFLLANDYNNKWLPAKMKKINEVKDNNSKLKLSDVIKDFKDSK